MTRIPTRLLGECVVIVNEYGAMFQTGHINLTFVNHGVDEGTFGQNIRGVDAHHRMHKQGRLQRVMDGGVFLEPNEGGSHCFVVVSQANFQSMLAYARMRAELTATSRTTYQLFGNNCADFATQVFQHSNLTNSQKLISRYLLRPGLPVVAYSNAEATYSAGTQAIVDTRDAVGRLLAH